MSLSHENNLVCFALLCICFLQTNTRNHIEINFSGVFLVVVVGNRYNVKY